MKRAQRAWSNKKKQVRPWMFPVYQIPSALSANVDFSQACGSSFRCPVWRTVRARAKCIVIEKFYSGVSVPAEASEEPFPCRDRTARDECNASPASITIFSILAFSCAALVRYKSQVKEDRHESKVPRQ